MAEVTNGKVRGGMGFEISQPELFKFVVSHPGVQDRIIAVECLEQPQAVGIVVDGQTSGRADFRAANHAVQHALVAAQQKRLEIGLQVVKRAHAEAAETADWRAGEPAIRRARSSSAISSASGGMLSSRSIMVETRPKRRSACA